MCFWGLQEKVWNLHSGNKQAIQGQYRSNLKLLFSMLPNYMESKQKKKKKVNSNLDPNCIKTHCHRPLLQGLEEKSTSIVFALLYPFRSWKV